MNLRAAGPFLAGCLALGASPCAAAQAQPPGLLTCLAGFYGGTPERRSGSWGLRLSHGDWVPLDDPHVRTAAARAEAPALRDLFVPKYEAGPIAEPEGDPGRTRSGPLLAARYGASRRAVAAALVPWRFEGQSFPVQPAALPAFERAAARIGPLLAADPGLRAYLEHMGGTFNWRAIAGTHRRSAHAYGIAVDLNPALGDYWRNSPHAGWKNRVPEAIVRAFEAEGFVWGGRWHHFDTMHFEWRPELFACAAEVPPPEPPIWNYAWLSPGETGGHAVDGNLLTRIPEPEGFVRVPLPEDGFGSFLRTLPMAPQGTKVVSFRGTPLYDDGRADFVEAVTALDVGPGDLQQCADSVIRLHAEWLWSLGVRSQTYQTLSGTRLSFSGYLAGERAQAHGRRLLLERSAPRSPPTRAAFREYLDEVFLWANTGSIRREGLPVIPADVAPGDYFVMEGTPWGHAVLILDEARASDGRLALLLGEGAVPAQSFHVIRPRGAASPWFVVGPDLRPQTTLQTPVWDPFPFDALRRLPVPPFPEAE